MPTHTFTPSLKQHVQARYPSQHHKNQVPIVQDTMQVMQNQINKLNKLVISSSKRLAYVPPHLIKGDDSKTQSQDLDANDEQIDMDAPILNTGKAHTIKDIHRVYQDFQVASHGY